MLIIDIFITPMSCYWEEKRKCRQTKKIYLSSRSRDTATPLSNVMFDISCLWLWASDEPRPCVCEIYNQSLEREREKKNKSDNKRPKKFSPFAAVKDWNLLKSYWPPSVTLQNQGWICSRQNGWRAQSAVLKCREQLPVTPAHQHRLWCVVDSQAMWGTGVCVNDANQRHRGLDS